MEIKVTYEDKREYTVEAENYRHALMQVWYKLYRDGAMKAGQEYFFAVKGQRYFYITYEDKGDEVLIRIEPFRYNAKGIEYTYFKRDKSIGLWEIMKIINEGTIQIIKEKEVEGVEIE